MRKASVVPIILALSVALTACQHERVAPTVGISSPTTTSHVAPFAALVGRLRMVVEYQERLAAAGKQLDLLPNTLALADGIAAATLVGQGGDFVVVARETGDGMVCRYHGGPTGDHLTICIDREGQTLRLNIPDLSSRP